MSATPAYRRPMVVVRWRVAWLTRKYLRATLLLGLAAGLASGLALAAWQSSRQAAVALDHFETLADPPELTMTFCPPEMTTLASDEIMRCFAYKPTEELARLRSLPEVMSADRFAYQFADVGPAGRPDQMERITFVAAGDPGVVTPGGEPVVIEGRLADPEAVDETVINEAAARTSGAGLGDRLDMRWLLPGEFERDAPATGPQLTLEIVGIVRTGADLSAFDGSDAAALLVTGPAIWRAVEDEAWLGFTGIAIQAADADAARAAIEAAFPGRVVQHRARNERRRSPAHPRRVRLRGERGTGLRRADGVGGVDLRRAGHRPSGPPGVDRPPGAESARVVPTRGRTRRRRSGRHHRRARRRDRRCRRRRAVAVDARRRSSVRRRGPRGAPRRRRPGHRPSGRRPARRGCRVATGPATHSATPPPARTLRPRWWCRPAGYRPLAAPASAWPSTEDVGVPACRSERP